MQEHRYAQSSRTGAGPRIQLEDRTPRESKWWYVALWTLTFLAGVGVLVVIVTLAIVCSAAWGGW